MTGATRIVLLWVVCLATSAPEYLPAAGDRSATLDGSHVEIRDLVDAGLYNRAESAAKEVIDGFGEQTGALLAKALALDLWVEARWRNGKAWHPGTLEAAEWSESLKRQALGPESAKVAESLFHQARVLDEWARFKEARVLYERAIALYRQAAPAADPRVGVAAAYLGGMLVELGELKAARPYLEGSLELLEATRGPDHPEVATALVNLAWLEKYSLRKDDAETLFERALAIREAALGSGHPEVGEPLDGLTRLRWETTSMQAARVTGRRARDIRLAALGPDHPSLVYNYVLLWWTEENPREARICIDRALSIAEESLPENHPLLALALNYWAVTNGASGDFVEALPHLDRALQILETSYGPDHWRVATVLSNIGMQRGFLGDEDRAQEAERRQLEIEATNEVQRFPANDQYEVAERLLESGSIDIDEAIRRGQEAIEFAQEIREALFYQGFMYETQAEWLELAGRLEEAAGTWEKALEVRTAQSGPDHMHLMDPLREYAALRAVMGDFDEALRLNGRALDILENQLGSHHLQLLWSLDLEARLYWGAGDLVNAFKSAERLESVRREILRQALAGLPERQSLGFFQEPLWGQDLMLSADVAQPRATWSLAAADAIIRSRGLVLDSLAQRHGRARMSSDPQIAALNLEVSAARERLARLAVAGDRGKDVGTYQQQLETARREKERAELALAAHDRLFRQQRYQSQAGLAEVAAALPPRSALVAFIRYERFELPAGEGASSWPLQSNRSYAALILLAGESAPKVEDLGSAESIDSSIRSLSRLTWQVAETAGRSPRRSLASYRREGAELRRRVWDPIAPRLEGVDRIFLVPDGELNLLPIGALPVGETSFLLESAPITHHLSAERDLIQNSADRPPDPDWSLLALGFPDYDEPNLFAALASEDSGVLQLAQADRSATDAVFRGQRATCGNFDSMHFAALPGSLTELESIGRTWRHDSEKAPATLLESSRANEGAFKDRAPGHQILHLATHGFFLGGECDAQARIDHEQLLENPLLLSGLALAGANHRASVGPNEEDGILTAEEIAALDLQSVQWAVLSGCETGIGQTKAGEGVFGLRRAFQIAGARTVIMSLWPVDDEATRDWMSALYRHRFENKLTTATAVHQASLDLLTARREAGLSTHPFYWAGFVAAGDWR